MFTLRQIGRDLGVRCPTSLKKADLIEQIILVEKGKILPHYSKVGRKLLNDEYEKIEVPKRDINNDREKFLLELEKLTLEYKEKIERLYKKYALF